MEICTGLHTDWIADAVCILSTQIVIRLIQIPLWLFDFLTLLYMKQSRHTVYPLPSGVTHPHMRVCPPLTGNICFHGAPMWPLPLSYFFIFPPLSLSLVRSLYFPPSHSFLRFSSPSPPAEHTSPVLCTSHSFFFSPTFSSPVHFWAPFFYFSPVSRLVFIPVLSFKSNKIQWHEMTVLITEKIDCKALDQAWTSQSWSKNLFQCRYSMIVFFMFYSRPMLVPRVKN